MSNGPLILHGWVLLYCVIVKRNVQLSIYLSSNISIACPITQYVALFCKCSTCLACLSPPCGLQAESWAAKRKVRFRGHSGLHPSDWAKHDPAVRGYHKTTGKSGGAHEAHRWGYQLLDPNLPQDMTAICKGIHSSLWFEYTAAVNQKAKELF